VRRLIFPALLLVLAGCAIAPPAGVEVRRLPQPPDAPAAGAEEKLADPAETLARHLAALSAQPPTSPVLRGNEAQLLVDGPKTHQAMFAAMERARDHVNLETYILEAGEIGERLARVVEKKVAQGVKVNILYDSVGSIDTPREYFERLRKIGARLCEFNPVNPAKAVGGWEINNRNHRKILVVDGRVAFTGGINISSAYSAGSRSNRRASQVKPGEDSPRGWRDTHVRAEGPVVSTFQRLFLDGWALEDCGAAVEANYFPRLEAKGGKTMRVLSSDPGTEKSEMYGALLSTIGNARHRVWLTVGYFVPDPQTRQALIDAARRGVDVRLVLPGFSDFWAPIYAARSNYSELLAAGVRIYEWREALMHAKTAVIDSVWSSVGSTNLDWRSFVHNYEADLVVYDAAFAQELERLFRDDVQASVEVHPEQWKKRGALERAKEWFARRWEYLL
jgi:cardiolipin synthase A/B